MGLIDISECSRLFVDEMMIVQNYQKQQCVLVVFVQWSKLKKSSNNVLTFKKISVRL